MDPALPVRLATRDEEGARIVTLHVSEDHACFAGHFPGRPIVPGVVLLHWAVAELAGWQERALEIVELEALKFRRPLLPGETFDLRLAPARSAKTFSFEMFDAAGPICSGRIRERSQDPEHTRDLEHTRARERA